MAEIVSIITSWAPAAAVFASVATIVASVTALVAISYVRKQVILARKQLRLARKQCTTTFEDSVAREYRELAATLPTKALLGVELTEEEYRRHFDEFYRYFDLCNEQAFLHQRRRIRRSTWEFWREGMASNLKRPAFKRAWSEVCARANSDFSELRAIFPPTRREVAEEQPNGDMIREHPSAHFLSGKDSLKAGLRTLHGAPSFPR